MATKVCKCEKCGWVGEAQAVAKPAAPGSPAGAHYQCGCCGHLIEAVQA